MKLKPLYKRTTTGDIQEWQMEIDKGHYRTISGRQDGKKVISEWTRCEGKSIGKSNETSTSEQALKEVEAKYKKQKESGYSETLEEVDETGFFRPMLAHEYKGGLEFPVYCQAKYDGIRCIASKEGLHSRNGKPFVTCGHILEALQSVFKDYPDLKLDGELYTDKYKNDFNTICSLIKRTKPTAEDLKAAKKNVQYWIYDIVRTDMNFSGRNMFISEFFKK